MYSTQSVLSQPGRALLALICPTAIGYSAKSCHQRALQQALPYNFSHRDVMQSNASNCAIGLHRPFSLKPLSVICAFFAKTVPGPFKCGFTDNVGANHNCLHRIGHCDRWRIPDRPYLSRNLKLPRYCYSDGWIVQRIFEYLWDIVEYL